MADEVDQVKEKIDVVEIIAQYIKLKKVGRSLVGLCPFHHEKTPSFNVSPERQMWYCFGCQKGGDVFAFLMQKEGLEFGEALRILAKQAGVELKERNFDPQKQQHKERLVQAVSLSSRLYQHVLEKNAIGKKASAYLEKRGVKKEMAQEFELGYAPQSWQATGEFLQKKGYAENELIEAGLVIGKALQSHPQPQGLPAEALAKAGVPLRNLRNWYDRFRGRLIFPIKDLFGRTVGFSARAIGPEEPKYLNSPDSPIFQKGNLLYRLDLAKEEIRNKDLAILVEGNLDVVSVYQAGFKNVVAPLGSALTEDHLKMLKRFTPNLVFGFDQDEGGQKATLRALPLAQVLGFNSNPDELVKKDPLAFAKAINEAVPALDYIFNYSEGRFDLKTASGKKSIADLVMPFLTATTDQIRLDTYIKDLAQKLGVEEKSIWQDIEKFKVQSSKFKVNLRNESSQSNLTPPAPKTRGELLGERLLTLILSLPPNAAANPQFYQPIASLTAPMLESEWQQELFEILASRFLAAETIDPNEIGQTLSPALKDLFNKLLLQPLPETETESEDALLSELQMLVLEIKKSFKIKELIGLKDQILKAEKENKPGIITEIKEKIRGLSAIGKTHLRSDSSPTLP